ncbi:uncharacterized protein BP01DRAFT_388037 [Aspergillus saccharolyticus JOP 1030-1]|uniref:Uncharacterized protein n=1 Tax=Aspergillus saccharolyticus JOP 1030-1 TaxID=1450539 RepID=A0A318ZQK6_9EURO|nr:hypothetical protein BP01DRAFT_388037 [Aspergillus saccharolyticus JOP 1030-1]PYH49899.1 hypothetical protein BP01DRAFT_388037 [Aspergillus saccharolyticus JOP 1030-1]
MSSLLATSRRRMDNESTAEDYNLTLHTLSLEREYDQTVTTTSHLLAQEARRVQRVDQLLLQFENENLQLQLDQARQEIGRVRSSELEILGRLNQLVQERDRIQQTVYVLGHEKESLSRELQSMSDTSVEMKSLMTEKMRLTKELAALQTEVQRLKAVESSSQALLAEKQALVRQVGSLEVELENERRAHERTRAASGESELQQQQLQQQKEQQQQREQQLQKQQQQQAAKWNAEKATLEDKIETLTKKLLATKDQLRKAQINNNNNSNITQPLPAGTSIVPVRWSREPSADRFAVAARINPELTIATPGAVRAKTADKEKRTAAAAAAALPGEKSAFSITPFLNRTTGGPSVEAGGNNKDNDVNPDNDNDDNNDTDQDSSALEDSMIRDPDPETAKEPRQKLLGGKSRPEKTTGAATTSIAGNTRRPRQQTARRLDPIDDDDDDIFGGSSLTTLAKPQVRKRKLGGQQKKIIMDEEDDDMDFDFRHAGTARGRGFGGVPAFSPLKRDRR